MPEAEGHHFTTGAPPGRSDPQTRMAQLDRMNTVWVSCWPHDDSLLTSDEVYGGGRALRGSPQSSEISAGKQFGNTTQILDGLVRALPWDERGPPQHPVLPVLPSLLAPLAPVHAAAARASTNTVTTTPPVPRPGSWPLARWRSTPPLSRQSLALEMWDQGRTPSRAGQSPQAQPDLPRARARPALSARGCWRSAAASEQRPLTSCLRWRGTALSPRRREQPGCSGGAGCSLSRCSAPTPAHSASCSRLGEWCVAGRRNCMSCSAPISRLLIR